MSEYFDVCCFVPLNWGSFLSIFPLDLMVLKDENQELNEMGEKDQYKNQHDFITGENILVVHRLKILPQERRLKR